MPLAALLLAGSAGFGQKWAEDMFDHTSHDFGTVARGAKVEHRFTVENIYVEDAHILSIRSSCGCTAPTVAKRTLKTWDKAEIVAEVDTRGYYGRKDATITVVFDQPFPAEVRLNVHTYIRSDVVVQPGSVQFGSIAQGIGAQRKVRISYAGRPDWAIQKVENNSPHLEATAVKSAAAPPGQVAYDLVVKLEPDAPVGHIREHLVLVTNDVRTESAHVPIAVEGVVVPTVSVRPSPLTGVAEVGKSVKKQLFVQGTKPFQILAVRCDDARFTFVVPQTAKTLHLIPVTFTAGQTPGKVAEKIRITTDLAGSETLDVPVDFRVTSTGPTAF